MIAIIRRWFVAFIMVGASGLATAQVAGLPDGIYLVTNDESERSIWLPIQGFDHQELVDRDRLMPLEIASAEAKLDENYGAPIVLITLADSSKDPFANLTEKNLNRQLALVVAGVVVVAPHVVHPIRGGQLQIGLPGRDLAPAREIADMLKRSGPH